MPTDEFDDRLTRAEKIAAVVALYETPELKLAVYRDLMGPATPSAPFAQGVNANNRQPPPPDDSGEEASSRTTATDAELFAKFANESGTTVEELQDVVYFDKGEPHLTGPARRLGKNKSDQSRTVALILTAAYHYALDTPDIASERVRKECDLLKCLDSGNFAASMEGVPGVNYVGASRSRQFRIKNDAPAALKRAIDEIRGTKASD
jgi:hypothetical protein